MSEPKDDAKKKLTGRDVADLLLGKAGNTENYATEFGDLTADQILSRTVNGTATIATSESTDLTKGDFPLSGENFKTLGKLENKPFCLRSRDVG